MKVTEDDLRKVLMTIAQNAFGIATVEDLQEHLQEAGDDLADDLNKLNWIVSRAVEMGYLKADLLAQATFTEAPNVSRIKGLSTVGSHKINVSVR